MQHRHRFNGYDDPSRARWIKAMSFQLSVNAGTHSIDKRKIGPLQELKDRCPGVVRSAFQNQLGAGVCNQERRKHRLKDKRGASGRTYIELIRARLGPAWPKIKPAGTDS